MSEFRALDFGRLRELAQRHADVFPLALEDLDELAVASPEEQRSRQRDLIACFRESLQWLMFLDPVPVADLLSHLWVMSVLGDLQSLSEIRQKLTGVRESPCVSVHEFPILKGF